MNSTSKDLPDQQEEVASESVEDPSSSQTLISPSHSATTPDIPEFGWSAYAERVNGRFAMIGFIAILVVEAFSKSSFLHWAGFIH